MRDKLLVAFNVGRDNRHECTRRSLGLGAGNENGVHVAHVGVSASCSRGRTVNGEQVRGIAGRRERTAGPVHDKRLLAGLGRDVPQRLGGHETRAECAQGDVLVVLGGDVVVNDAVRHGVSTRAQRCPHRRGDGGIGAQKHQVVTTSAALHELLQMGHLALVDHALCPAGIHSVHAKHEQFVGKTA